MELPTYLYCQQLFTQCFNTVRLVGTCPTPCLAVQGIHVRTTKHFLLGWFDLKHETLQLGTTSCVSSLSLPDITQMAKSPSPSPSIFAYTRLEVVKALE